MYFEPIKHAPRALGWLPKRMVYGKPKAPNWDGPRFRPTFVGIAERTRPHSEMEGVAAAITPEAVCILTVAGQALLETPERSVRVNAGDVLLLRTPGQFVLRKDRGPEPWIQMSVHLAGETAVNAMEYLLHRYGMLHELKPTAPVFKATARLIDLYHRKPERSASRWSTETYAWFTTLWDDVERHVMSTHLKLEETTDLPPPSRLVTFSKISMKEFAQQLGYSPTHLSRKLGKAWGMRPSTILRQHRLNEAAQLLRASTLSIEEIATKCGYTGAPAFCRAFTWMHNKTPGEYRRTHA